MASAFKCDRCKEHFDGKPLCIVRIEVNDSDWYQIPTAELCNSCAYQVFKHLTDEIPKAAVNAT